MSKRVALVTGGTGGIGRSVCRRLAISDYVPVIGYRTKQPEAQELAAELGGVAVHCAVDDPNSLSNVARTIGERFGQLDLLVNNAGTTRFVPHDNLDELDDELFDLIMITNVRGAFACLRACRSLLDKSNEAVVINISSIAAQSGIGSNVAYCASKAALDSLTRSLGRALAPGIRVVSVSPGPVDTEFIKGLDPAWRDQQVSRCPMQRFAAPEEVAEAVLVAARMLTFTTGSILSVDGGRRLA